MPLIDPAGDEPRNLTCACGKESNDWQSHWLHAIRECPLDRCATCFHVLDEKFTKGEEHVCPSIQLSRFKTKLRKLIDDG